MTNHYYILKVKINEILYSYEAYKLGFKIHLLCDSNTHYLYNMIFDPGKYGKEFLYFDKNDSIYESIVLQNFQVTIMRIKMKF